MGGDDLLLHSKTVKLSIKATPFMRYCTYAFKRYSLICGLIMCSNIASFQFLKLHSCNKHERDFIHLPFFHFKEKFIKTRSVANLIVLSFPIFRINGIIILALI